MYICTQAPSTTNKSVLVVDDILDNCMMLQTLLEIEGYDVKIAEDGYEALDIIESSPPGLILLDMMMPGIDGLEVAKRIRCNKELPFIPIILLTAWDNLSDSNDFEKNIDGYISKPIDFDRLFTEVETLTQN
jgi:CheY-like chemotaxis protein